MGDGMMMKLASNWHEMAMKQLWNLRKCYEITEQFKKSSHDKDKDKEKEKENLSNQSNSLKEQKNYFPQYTSELNGYGKVMVGYGIKILP